MQQVQGTASLMPCRAGVDLESHSMVAAVVLVGIHWCRKDIDVNV